MKIGLVLAGGGARGAYQIGVWKALRELNIDKYIKVISGTSIGALNSILISQGNFNYAEELWSKISQEEILPITSKQLSLKSMILTLGVKQIDFVKKYIPSAIAGGNLSREGIYKFMDDIDFSLLKEQNIICYATCTEIPELRVKYFKLNDYEEEKIRDILAATSAIPMIFDGVDIDGSNYLDGGIVDNLPVQPVYGEACDLIIVVHLSKCTEIDKSKYDNTPIIEIVPSVIEEGEVEGMLDFYPDMSKKRMHVGYMDTINKLKAIMELTRFIDNNNKEVRNRGNIFKEWVGKIRSE